MGNAHYDKPTYVYLIRAGETAFYKIGYSFDVPTRIAQGFSLPREMRGMTLGGFLVIATARFPSRGEAAQFEAQMHRAFKSYTMGNEWFRFGDAQRAAAVEMLEKRRTPNDDPAGMHVQARLNPDKPDERRALEVFQAWTEAGYSAREIVTQALRALGGLPVTTASQSVNDMVSEVVKEGLERAMRGALEENADKLAALVRAESARRARKG